jgi:hypothetical protein
MISAHFTSKQPLRIKALLNCYGMLKPMTGLNLHHQICERGLRDEDSIVLLTMVATKEWVSTDGPP